MVYKKFIDGVPSLSSLILAGVVFSTAACKPKKPAPNTEKKQANEGAVDSGAVDNKLTNVIAPTTPPANANSEQVIEKEKVELKYPNLTPEQRNILDQAIRLVLASSDVVQPFNMNDLVSDGLKENWILELGEGNLEPYNKLLGYLKMKPYKGTEFDKVVQVVDAKRLKDEGGKIPFVKAIFEAAKLFDDLARIVNKLEKEASQAAVAKLQSDLDSFKKNKLRGTQHTGTLLRTSKFYKEKDEAFAFSKTIQFVRFIGKFHKEESTKNGALSARNILDAKVPSLALITGGFSSENLASLSDQIVRKAGDLADRGTQILASDEWVSLGSNSGKNYTMPEILSWPTVTYKGEGEQSAHLTTVDPGDTEGALYNLYGLQEGDLSRPADGDCNKIDKLFGFEQTDDSLVQERVSKVRSLEDAIGRKSILTVESLDFKTLLFMLFAGDHQDDIFSIKLPKRPAVGVINKFDSLEIKNKPKFAELLAKARNSKDEEFAAYIGNHIEACPQLKNKFLVASETDNIVKLKKKIKGFVEQTDTDPIRFKTSQINDLRTTLKDMLDVGSTEPYDRYIAIGLWKYITRADIRDNYNLTDSFDI
ncbi:MAG: hypothetical protein K2X94_02535, partial [Amoebophilaceae bacterium]|nr:hypothetical protein [Amoebophilaceae bacterium]